MSKKYIIVFAGLFLVLLGLAIRMTVTRKKPATPAAGTAVEEVRGLRPGTDIREVLAPGTLNMPRQVVRYNNTQGVNFVHTGRAKSTKTATPRRISGRLDGRSIDCVGMHCGLTPARALAVRNAPMPAHGGAFCKGSKCLPPEGFIDRAPIEVSAGIGGTSGTPVWVGGLGPAQPKTVVEPKVPRTAFGQNPRAKNVSPKGQRSKFLLVCVGGMCEAPAALYVSSVGE